MGGSDTEREARRWAVILGVTGGTGSAVARAVARDPGLNIIGFHRGNRPDAGEGLRRALDDAGRRLEIVTLDAGNVEGASQGADAVLARLGAGSVGLFVHAIANASVGRLASGDDQQLAPRQLQKTLEAMSISFVYWTQELLRRDLLAPSARLLALSNPMDDAVVGGTAAIAASKAALGAFVRHLAHELGPRGHRINLLKFGAVTTAAVRRTFGDGGTDRLVTVLEEAIPARRLCSADEVGRFVSVLAGEAGAWFNGATIDFTGGEFQGLMNVLVHGKGVAR